MEPRKSDATEGTSPLVTQIEAYRAKLNWNTTEFTNKTGISNSTLLKWKKGELNISRRAINRLAFCFAQGLDLIQFRKDIQNKKVVNFGTKGSYPGSGDQLDLILANLLTLGGYNISTKPITLREKILSNQAPSIGSIKHWGKMTYQDQQNLNTSNSLMYELLSFSLKINKRMQEDSSNFSFNFQEIDNLLDISSYMSNFDAVSPFLKTPSRCVNLFTSDPIVKVPLYIVVNSNVDINRFKEMYREGRYQPIIARGAISDSLSEVMPTQLGPINVDSLADAFVELDSLNSYPRALLADAVTINGLENKQYKSLIIGNDINLDMVIGFTINDPHFIDSINQSIEMFNSFGKLHFLKDIMSVQSSGIINTEFGGTL